MADIVEEKRKSSPKIEFEERKRILFHIESVQGLPQAGWQPVASTFVSVESLDTRESFPTEYKKTNSAIVWGENIPIIDLKDSSKVRFEVRSHVLWNKTVLGKTETFSVRELIKMQNDVGEDRDAFISLILTLPPSTHASASPTHQTSFKSPSSPNSKIPTLSFSIREIATKDRNNTITAVDLQRFVERCQSEALEELREIVEKIVHLRQAFEGSSFVCLLDIILGVSEGVRKAITNPITKNINKNTVACIKALNCALVPYQSLSGRQLAKTSENSTVLMKEMLCGAVKALACVETFLRMKQTFERDKFEFKVTDWLRYFEECERFLLGTEPRKPDPLVNKKSRRVHCPSLMVANPDLPAHNMLPMSLPEVYNTESYNRPDLVRLVAEWVFSPSFRQRSSTEANVIPKAPNVLCLSGPAECGKTQLAVCIAEWLGELGCLGGYFTFSRDAPGARAKTLTSRQLLDALPVTLVHQACTVEPDAAAQLNGAFAKNLWVLDESLEKRFDALFVTPMRAFVAARVNAGGAWNPLEPMVFVIDDLGKSTSSGKPAEEESKEAAETRRTLSLFAEWITSNSVRSLPAHIKFLILARPESGVERTMKEKGVGFVCEMGPQHVDSSSFMGSGSPGLRSPRNGGNGYGNWSEEADKGNAIGNLPSSSAKVAIQAL